MAIHAKTIEYAFQSRDTELGAGVRYNFPAITLYLPETASRTFRSVRLVVWARDTVTAPTTLTAPTLGVKLGAAAFDDSVMTAMPNTGESQAYEWGRDVTSYFAANFGAGGSQSCQVGVQFGAATTINIGAKLVITYECEDAAVRARTVRIPLNSSLDALTEVLAEIGTDQIPALNTFLPEQGKVYRSIWLECVYNEYLTGPGDAALGMQIDAGAEHLSGAHEGSLQSSCFGVYLWSQGAAPAWSTATVHKLKLRSTLVATGCTFRHLAIVLYVTYEYDHAATKAAGGRVMNSLVLGMPRLDTAPGTAATDELSETVEFWVEEPGPVELAQSGALIFFTPVNNYPDGFKIGAGAFRTYQEESRLFCGQSAVTIRVDAGAEAGQAFSLARGRNRFVWSVYCPGYSAGQSGFEGLLLLNYTSAIHEDGDGAHNRSTCWSVTDSNFIGYVQQLSAKQWIDVPETDWFLTDLLLAIPIQVGAVNPAGLWLHFESLVGEWSGGGYDWIDVAWKWVSGEAGVISFYACGTAFRDRFRRWANDLETYRFDVQGNRRLRLGAGTSMVRDATFWLTYHAITFEVAGEVRGSKGGTVDLRVYQEQAVGGERHVLSGSRAGNGPFSFAWYDDTEPVSVRMYEDTEHHGASKEGVAV